VNLPGLTDHDLIDNRTTKLDAAVAEFLDRSARAHFVLGHLFIPGLVSIIDRLGQLDSLRCLIGNTTHAETTEQLFERHLRVEDVQGQVERQLYLKRPELRRIVRKAADDLREVIALMDQTDDSLGLLRSLTGLIEDGKFVLRIYPRGRLTAKAYLFDADPGGARDDDREVAVLGTSNLTHARVAHPTDLNVVVRGRENYAGLLGWFEELWEQSEDFGPAVVDAIRDSWASDRIRPYDVYMKTLYSLLKDRLDDEASREVLWDDEIVTALADYQKLAVRQAVQKIRDYGGAFIADVVGLGKSFVGAAILKQFERNERARGLIVCPAHLVPMWERYNEHYQLNARVMSMGLLREGDRASNILLDDDRYRFRDFVLIDESHNFRNTDTQRYRLMQQFLAAGKRCCFLTATPRNQCGWDVYNQIKLFHQEDRTDLPIDPPDLREYFRLVERGDRSLPELLSHVLIRRTRNHIVKWYGYDAETDQPIDPSLYAEYRSGKRRCYVRIAGRKQFFPRRDLGTIQYSIEDTYSGIYQDLRRAIGNRGHHRVQDAPPEGLTFARYAIGRYLKRDRSDDPRYARLKGATASLHGLVRILLFKRFESSVHAFRETVRRLIASHQAFKSAVESGRIPTGEEADAIDADLGDGDDDVLDRGGQAASTAYDIEDFLQNYLIRDLEHDLGILHRILEMVAPITPDQDAKLSVLKELVDSPTFGGRKLLIFTQYTDTAEYLYGALDPVGDDPRVAVVHSGVSDFASLVGRFAPRSNPSLNAKGGGPEIATLITTDVLAEGMNLQDCDTIINYDLHWNPVRLIQRFGRIDRIGTEFETIRGFNFLPETGLERNLGLRQRLQHRIQEIHDTIGEDTAILDASERLNESAMYAIYEPGEASESLFDQEEPGDLVDLGEAEEMLRLLRREDPVEFDRIVGLADGIRSGKPEEEAGTYVLCRAGRYHKAYVIDAKGGVVTNDMPRILGRIKCGPDLEPIALSPEHGRNVVAAKKFFAEEVQSRAVEREQSKSFGVGQRYILHELRRLLSEIEDQETRTRILLFDGVFRGSVTNAVRRELNLIRRNGLSGTALLNELGRIYQDHRLRNRPERDERDDETAPRIVCSMTLR
jgi:superfamily II DNA or RNA helicase